MDSLSAVALTNALSTDFGRQLPASLVFDYPSAAAVAAYLHGLMAPLKAAGEQPVQQRLLMPTAISVEAGLVKVCLQGYSPFWVSISN
jgi:Phosphopantetheine attachment site